MTDKKDKDPKEKRDDIVRKNVEKLFEPDDPNPPSWETGGKGAGPEGEYLTVEDLVRMKPFKEKGELSEQIGIRVTKVMLRTATRIKERSRAYDIMTDFNREAYKIGLVVLAERMDDIFGVQQVIGRMRRHTEMKEEAQRLVKDFIDEMPRFTPPEQRSYFLSFIESIKKKETRAREVFFQELKSYPSLGDLLKTLDEDALE